MFNKANNIKNAIHITKNAWNKLNTIQNNKYNQFLFSAKGGGCNGFSYNLKKITSEDIQEFNIRRFPPTTITHNHLSVVIDPQTEIYLLGTTIDYIEENMEKDIYESKFIFTPDKNIATSCGCGVSFSPNI